MMEYLSARNWQSIPPEEWDDPDYGEWMLRVKDVKYLLKIANVIFDDSEKLRVFTPDEWNDDWISSSRYADQEPDFGDPFAD
jgi:hypothetical protein